LRSDPIRILIFDEIDGYPDDCEGEGNPIDIAARRTDTFEDAKILKGSTPAKPEGLSQIESDFLRSDQRYYWVPCPFCGFMQPLAWRDLGEFVPPGEESKFRGVFGTGEHRLKWEKDEKGRPVPGSARYHCAQCGKGIDERHKQRMLDAGQWRARFPERRDMEGYIVAGFAINALYSPWKSTVWGALAQEWYEATDNPEKLKAFVNLRLGETWSDDADAEKVDESVLAKRLERYPIIEPLVEGELTHWNNSYVPERCCVLVGTADIQAGGGGRIEAQITGFGPGEESWLIAHEAFYGDAGVPIDHASGESVWEELDSFFLREWRHQGGALLRPSICFVDSGDQTDAVYEYVLPRQRPPRRVFAIKGVDRLTVPALVKQGTANKSKVRLYLVATIAAKDRVYSRLRIPPHPLGEAKPGYHHIPDWVMDEYLKQLTSARKIRERDKRTRRFYERYVPVHPRDEALDLTVYAHAGLFVLQNFINPTRYRNLEKIQQEVIQLGETAPTPAVFQPESKSKRRGIRHPGISL